MKKILFPALTALLLVGSPAAFAQSGPWYVVFDSTSHTCDADHRVGVGDHEKTIGGPYASQAEALSAIHSISQCGGSFGGM